MVADPHHFSLKEDPSIGMQLVIVNLKADKKKLARTIGSAHQKLQDGETLSSEEQAALIVEEEGKATARRAEQRAAVEAHENSLRARMWRALGEIW